MSLSEALYRDRVIQVGLNVAHYRKLRNLTQNELAEKADLSRTIIAMIEAPDVVKSFSFRTLFKISEALDIDASKLFEFRTFRDEKPSN